MREVDKGNDDDCDGLMDTSLPFFVSFFCSFGPLVPDPLSACGLLAACISSRGNVIRNIAVCPKYRVKSTSEKPKSLN